MKDDHFSKVARLQEQIREKPGRVALRYAKGHSNTTRSKIYKNDVRQIECGPFDEILSIDPSRKIAIVEPRVTMEALALATTPLGLMAPVIPEFKGITVGGAVMGGAAESSSHKQGIFSDACLAHTIICGDGELLRTTPEENPDVFYGLSGSYGSLGALISTEIQLQPIQKYVRLFYRVFSDPESALNYLRSRIHDKNSPDFIEGIVFSKEHAVVIEGRSSAASKDVPFYSMQSLHAPWYWQHAQEMSDKTEEIMPLCDYLFRHDQGAFWMGAYLFRFSLLSKLIGQGILGIGKPTSQNFEDNEVRDFCRIPSPGAFLRTISAPFLSSQKLWAIFHRAEKWLQDRVIVQDFCIPEDNAGLFLNQVLVDPGTFPLWICPIKGSRKPQIFVPNYLSQESQESHFINIGIYGLPSYYAPIREITKKLEQLTQAHRGRKVLYSRSYYSQEEFWRIYPYNAYESLREKTHAQGKWHDITEKVLSA